jgi:Sulfotransferase domain
MPKCGSTWFYEFMQRRLSSLGYPTAHEALRDTTVTLNWKGNPGGLTRDTLSALLSAAERQTFVIKAHASPSRELLDALRAGKCRMLYIIRHPAAVVRSSITFGEFCRQHPELEPGSPCARIYTPEDSAEFVKSFVSFSLQWLETDQSDLIRRYEDIFHRGDDPIKNLAYHLFPLSVSVTQGILDEMRPERLSESDRKRLRINQKSWPELNDTVSAICEQWAKQLGYRESVPPTLTRFER